MRNRSSRDALDVDVIGVRGASTLAGRGDGWAVHHGCALHVLSSDIHGYDHRLGYAEPSISDNSVDAIISDPPYGLSRSDDPRLQRRVSECLQAWLSGDRDYVPSRAPGIAGWDVLPPLGLWDQCWRVLKPGGHALIFAAPRTADLVGIALRLAGFELRDQILYLINGDRGVSTRQLPNGYSTTLKPAHAHILVARKPLSHAVEENLRLWGTGALNVDGCRIGETGGTKRVPRVSRSQISDRDGDLSIQRASGHDKAAIDKGRWPANVVLDSESASDLDASAQVNLTRRRRFDMTLEQREAYGPAPLEGVGSGGPSRLFYTARATGKQRATATLPTGLVVSHPTAKPLSVMRWLVRLVTPATPDGPAAGGLFLDPFAGSGTLGEASLAEGGRALLIEREAEYVALITERLRP